MKLSELKDGDIVVRADDSVRMLIGSAFKGGSGFLDKDGYAEDLTYPGNTGFRIVQVYRSKGRDTFGHEFRWSDSIANFRPGNWASLYKAKPLPPDIKIGQYTVAFNDDSIKIGCTTVSKETVNEIYKRLNAAS